MSLPVSAHYLEIAWTSPGVAASVMVAPEPIEIELDAERGEVMTAETLAYNGMRAWVGLRLVGDLADVQPTFKSADGSTTPLLPISDGQGVRWWIQNDGWDPEKQRHLSELHRTMGQFTVVMGRQRLVLNNVMGAFTRTDVDEYLADFKDDLFWLLIGSSGATVSGGGGTMASPRFVKALEDLTAAARRVLANPARIVREVGTFDRPSRLRPNAATFRHHLRSPASQRLPGRGAEETADHADNRYLRHMVQVSRRLAGHIAGASANHARLFDDRAQLEDTRAITDRTVTCRKVDPLVFDVQLREMKMKLESVARFQDSGSGVEGKDTTLAFSPGKDYDDYSRDGRIFANTPREQRDHDPPDVFAYRLVGLPRSLIELMRATGRLADHYIVRGLGRTVRGTSRTGKTFEEILFYRVDSVLPVSEAITRKERLRARLEQDDWWQRLSSDERRELQREANAAEKRARVYRERGRLARLAGDALGLCQADLQRQDFAWRQLGVTASSAIPLGVRFSQSPDYAACQAAFSRVTALATATGLGPDDLEEIDRIGVVNASAVYERWCLVKILLTLTGDFCFEPEAGWQEKLIKAVGRRQQSEIILLVRNDLGLHASLEVQPELPNGRRPDFRLRFSYGTSISNTVRRDGLVMDAKLRTEWRKGDLGRMLSQLVLEKRYDQQGDRVFILHPAPGAIQKITSPLGWARDCHYGHDARNGHQSGVIYLAPARAGLDSHANLKRLLVLLLQATFPEPEGENESEDKGERTRWRSRSFCVSCSTVHGLDNVTARSTSGGRTYWTLSCRACGMWTIRTHCYQCRGRALFKNGLLLTYHRTVAEQVTHVVCPDCGSDFGAEGQANRQDGYPLESE